jgi:hypothetical protein
MKSIIIYYYLKKEQNIKNFADISNKIFITFLQSPSIMRKFNVAVLGLGIIGMKNGFDTKRRQPASHVAAITSNKDLKLVAVCDPDSTTRQVFIEKYGNDSKVLDNYKELFDDLEKDRIELDIVVIATPDSTHEEILRNLISILNHKDRQTIIFCEKPITLSIESAQEIKKLLKNSKIKIVVNHIRRWSRMWNEAYLLSKHIGRIEKAAFYFSTSPENKEISQIRDGIHIADILNWFGISEKTSVNRLMIPYFINDFYLWGTEGKIEILNYDQLLNFYKLVESSRFSGFKELELVKALKYAGSSMATAYSEFVEFLKGWKPILSTNLDEAVDALIVFEKYVYDRNISKNKGDCLN